MPGRALPAKLAGPPLSDREAIADLCYRVTASIDHADEELYWSTTTPEIYAEVAGTTVSGAEELKAKVWDNVIKVDTIHYLTNMRIGIDTPTTARVTFTSLAQHCRRGKGFEPGPNRFTTGAIYNCEAVKIGDLWKLKKYIASHVWGDGDPSVMVA
ncbi:hypothetical protein F5Y04DRAFT_292156 [Hypomontagnella monticulosa]|nr:hypothetical protein F5Y04DRAFT_292156 [Hypomontagnella monticulosa]